LKGEYDYRFCSFGSSIGKKCDEDTYCKELCLTIHNHKEKIIDVLKLSDFKKIFPSISTPYVASWQVYKYLKEQMFKIINFIYQILKYKLNFLKITLVLNNKNIPNFSL
jgi:hypothetical protein